MRRLPHAHGQTPELVPSQSIICMRLHARNLATSRLVISSTAANMIGGPVAHLAAEKHCASWYVGAKVSLALSPRQEGIQTEPLRGERMRSKPVLLLARVFKGISGRYDNVAEDKTWTRRDQGEMPPESTGPKHLLSFSAQRPQDQTSLPSADQRRHEQKLCS